MNIQQTPAPMAAPVAGEILRFIGGPDYAQSLERMERGSLHVVSGGCPTKFDCLSHVQVETHPGMTYFLSNFERAGMKVSSKKEI